MKYLVTGGAGFIGGHLIKKLLDGGNKVTSIDNYCTGKVSNHQEGCNYINFDIRNDNFDIIKEKPDVIFHLAYPYGVDGMGLDQAYIDTGLVGTYNILKYATKNSVKKVVNISSVSAYGIINADKVNEGMVGKPYIHYGVTKKASEEYCKIFKGTYGLDTVNLRLFYAYGERYATFDHSALVNFLDRAKNKKDLLIYGNGTQLRDYTYISDIVDGIIKSVNGKGDGEIYNISGGGTCSILELAQTVLKVTKANVKINFTPQSNYRWSDEYVKIPLGLTSQNKKGDWFDERNYVADITKAKNDFDYNPKISLEEGIKKTWKWINQ
jgi:UDP-glucose 4-epimerase